MKRLAIGLAVMTVSGALPTMARADLPAPAPNGQFAFASGRDDGATVLADAVAQIWLLSSAGGTPSRLTTTENTLHHRHPAWSPDHTKLVYAVGASGFAGPWDLIVHDFTTGTNNNITDTDVLTSSADRASFSPDGSKVAYQGTDSGGNTDVIVRAADGTGGETLVAQNAETGEGAPQKFTRPHWTPNGSTILYGKEDTSVPTDLHDIFTAPANGSNTNGVQLIGGTTNDYQPYVSPDGSQFCFTRETSGTTKDVLLATIAGFVNPTTVATGGQNFECAFSPDAKRVAWGNGAFNDGIIRVRDVIPSFGSTSTVTNDSGDGRFDGNIDWAANFRPTCQGASASVGINGFVSIPLACTDIESGDVDAEIASNPAHGNLGSIDDNPDPNTVIYTPNANFSGTDSFTFTGNDQNSDSNPATITVTVGDSGGGGANGKDATAAKIDRVSLSRRTWRRGRSLPSLLSRAGVGTTISFRLSEKARVTLTFSRKASGRRVGRRCVKPTRKNRTRRRCTRYVKAGTLRINGKAGNNRVKFQGRLSRRKRLALGRYRLTVGATDGAGNKSRTSRPVAFRIVRR